MVDLPKGESFSFLGFEYRRIRSRNRVWRPYYAPKLKKRTALFAKLREVFRRNVSQPVGKVIEMINPILRGWYGYFRESHRTGLSGPDGWLRRRLRAVLRKREKRPGYGLNEADSRRWPNRWFAARGLFSLEHGSYAYG